MRRGDKMKGDRAKYPLSVENMMKANRASSITEQPLPVLTIAGSDSGDGPLDCRDVPMQRDAEIVLFGR